MIGVAVGMGAAAFFNPALVASPLFDKIWASVVLAAAADFAGAIADSLTSNRGTNITSRQVAAYRQIVYGPQRIGGVIIYRSTTGSKHDQYNMIIVLATHTLHAITGLYLDGRRVYFDTSSNGSETRNGVTFGGHADGGDHIAPDGSTYNFGGLVFCRAYYGDQAEGTVCPDMTANDPKWTAGSDGRSPWVGGCAYLYVKLEDDQAMFPGEPEIRVDVLGKDDIYDPRTETRIYTNNWSLVQADIVAGTRFGLSAPVNKPQLIAAANLCEEQVTLAAGGTESRYLCGWKYDTGTAPGDVLQALMPVAAGRVTFIGGEWYIFPAAWTDTEFEWDESALTGPVKETPQLARRDLCNRMTGTFTAPNWPYNPDAGNLYDQNGWYNDTREDTFALQWQPTSIPAYSRDTRHGYSGDVDLDADGGKLLVKDVDLRGCLSLSQAQRVLKILYLRNRLGQFKATYPMVLAAYQMIPTTAFGFTFKRLGDARRVLEVSDTRFMVQPPQSGREDGKVPAFLVEHDVNSTSPDIYEWSPTEELTIYNSAATSQINSPYLVAAPTGLTLMTRTSTGTNPGVGGNSTNFAIAAGFLAPLDGRVVSIESQARSHGSVDWSDGGTGSVDSAVVLIYGVNQGGAYDVRIRGVRASGAVSAWVEQDNYTV